MPSRFLREIPEELIQDVEDPFGFGGRRLGGENDLREAAWGRRAPLREQVGVALSATRADEMLGGDDLKQPAFAQLFVILQMLRKGLKSARR